MTKMMSRQRSEDAIHQALLQAGECNLDPIDDSQHNRRVKYNLNKFKQTSSIDGFKKGEAETIRRVLDEIELVSVKRMSEVNHRVYVGTQLSSIHYGN